jgi:MinD-like ATPase involved in chromosome partitioning or flagellar assembly
MIVVLMVASGAAWESAALTALTGRRGVVVLKRCVDIDDLLASASAGQADVAVLGLDSPGLDRTAVDHLRKHGVRPVAVVAADMLEPGRARGSRIGIHALVADDRLATLAEVVASPDTGPDTGRDPGPDPGPDPSPTGNPSQLPAVPVPEPGHTGRVIVVWGPAGAPGRTTVASAIAGELARRRRRTVLVDADPYGGTVAQQLGVVDEVSGLLAAARLAGSGELEARFTSVQRGVDGCLSVITGLPRPDRYVEVRSGTLGHLLEIARGQADVVVDTGFSLEEDPAQEYATRPGRNQLTLDAIAAADELVVVGSADPMGLSRLARGLVDLRELAGGLAGGLATRVVATRVVATRVVVNRMRPTLGWAEKDIAGMVEGFARPTAVHFLPEDRVAVDRALVAGRMLVETGESALTRAVRAVVDALPPGPNVRGAQEANSR